jgi:hypothetical protein
MIQTLLGRAPKLARTGTIEAAMGVACRAYTRR